MQGNHERETESQQQRVSLPSEPRAKQKVNNKESVTPGRRIQEPRPSWSNLIKHRPLQLPYEPLNVDTLFGEQTNTK